MMTKKLSDTEYAVLSLLGEGERHGYEIEGLITARGMREWIDIGFSSIYFLLGKLEERGLARSTAGTRGPKSRKVFAITHLGRAHLAEMTGRMLAIPNRVFPRVLLGMANWTVLGEPAGMPALEQRREALIREIARVETVRDSQRPLPDFVEALFDYAISQLRTDVAWIERTRLRLETTLEKIDYKKLMPKLYSAPSGKFVAIDVPVMQFVKIDGQGDPNTDPSYKRAIEWLYSVSYTMKFAAKATGKDYIVPPLEGLWRADDLEDFVKRRKARWCWTMMIMAPDFTGQPMFETAIEKTRNKLGKPPETLRLEPLDEGHCLQTLHIGSYDAEGPVLAKLHNELMPAQGLTFAGPHHEIYLSDARKTAPERLKTILRQPVKASG
jgi:DNA-binding PadR family transcriptional regulator